MRIIEQSDAFKALLAAAGIQGEDIELDDGIVVDGTRLTVTVAAPAVPVAPVIKPPPVAPLLVDDDTP